MLAFVRNFPVGTFRLGKLHRRVPVQVIVIDRRGPIGPAPRRVIVSAHLQPLASGQAQVIEVGRNPKVSPLARKMATRRPPKRRNDRINQPVPRVALKPIAAVQAPAPPEEHRAPQTGVAGRIGRLLMLEAAGTE
jgi:hypothetical protein